MICKTDLSSRHASAWAARCLVRSGHEPKDLQNCESVPVLYEKRTSWEHARLSQHNASCQEKVFREEFPGSAKNGLSQSWQDWQNWVVGYFPKTNNANV